MTDQTEIRTLDLEQLETRALGLVWGLTSSVSKDGDGNPLLAQLAAAFGEEYALRTGKLWLLPNTEHDFELNFEQYSVNDLKNAFFHFAALSAAFETNDKRSSAKFCGAILVLISNALDSHSEAGHALEKPNALNYEGGGYTTVKRRSNRMGEVTGSIAGL